MPVNCPKCGEGLIPALIKDGIQTCIRCGYHGPQGETSAQYKEKILAPIKAAAAEKQAYLARIKADPNARLAEHPTEIRNILSKGPPYPSKDIYVLKVSDSAKTCDRAINCRRFPNGLDFPEIVDEPLGFVYVGVSDNPVKRFEGHAGREPPGSKNKPAKIAKLGHLFSYTSFEECSDGLTEKYGIKNVYWEKYLTPTGKIIEKRQEAVESWLGWALYKAGYWVWGPHYHKEVDFLESEPFL